MMLLRHVTGNRSRFARGARVMFASSLIMGTSAYAYDANNGSVIPRTTRTFIGAVQTFIDYKYLMDDTKVTGADEMHEKVATRWHKIVCENEGLYIKLGQQVTTMGHILPPIYMKIFSKLQDKAPQISRSDVDGVFMKEFGKVASEMYREFDYTPIASASIAQVHKATMHDGTRVAVKVQKPMIAKQVSADLWSYRLCVRALEYAFDLPMYWTVHDVCDAITTELDFEQEMQHAIKAKKLLADTNPSGDIYIPDYMPTYTSRRVMTMEFCDGVKVTNKHVIEGEWGLSCAETTHMMVTAFSQQIFLHGFVHGDPHPGNVFVRPMPGTPRRPQLVILDHGMYVEFSEKFRKEYALLWKAMVLMDMDTLTSVCAEWGIGDATFFASSQMFKPYSKDMVSATQKPSRQEILRMRQDAKERVRNLLSETDKIPRELIILGRNLNIVRAVNKDMNSPVNRAKVLAQYASLGLEYIPPHYRTHDHTSSQSSPSTNKRWSSRLILAPRELAQAITSYRASEFVFWLRMAGLEVVYRFTQLFRYVNVHIFGRQHKGFEEVLDEQMQESLQRMGLNTSNLDDGLG